MNEDNRFGCAKCSEFFNEKFLLLQHYIEDHSFVKCEPFAALDCDNHPNPLTVKCESPELLSSGDPSPSDGLSCSPQSDGLSEYVFGCSHCLRLFCSQDLLIQHLAEKHPPHRINAVADEKPEAWDYRGAKAPGRPCHFCGALFQTAKILNEHLLNAHHDLLNFGCFYCTERFLTEQQKYLHEARVHGTAELFICGHCDEEFLDASDRTKHSRKVHGKEAPPSRRDTPSITTNPSDRLAAGGSQGSDPDGSAKHLQFKCYYCSESFHLTSDRSAHIRRVHLPADETEDLPEITNETCSDRAGLVVQGNEVLRSARCSDSKEESARRFDCRFCGKALASWSTRRVHEMAFHLGRVFKCRYCERGFRTSSALSYHIRCHHRHPNSGIIKRPDRALLSTGAENGNVSRRLDCRFCAKVFTAVPSRKLHENAVHRKKRLFKCSQCGERFKYASYRSEHVRSTHPEEPSHLTETEEEPCLIENAEAEVEMVCHAAEHAELAAPAILIEEAYQGYHSVPNVAQQSYLSFNERMNHREDVHGARLAHFKCRFCPQAFGQKSHRAYHESSKHTHARPFQCSFCFKCFIDKSQANLHVRQYHSASPSTATPMESRQLGRSEETEMEAHSALVESVVDSVHEGTSMVDHSASVESVVSSVLQAVVGGAEPALEGLDPEPEALPTRRSVHKCRVCGASFNTHYLKKKHMQLHHSGPDDRSLKFKCDVCGRAFVSDQFLQQHMLAQHGSSYFCRQCGEAFLSEHEMLSHTHQVHPGPSCSSSETMGMPPQHRNTDQYLGYPLVSEGFAAAVPMDKPVAVLHYPPAAQGHYGYGNLKCPLCPFEFTTLDALLLHETSEHRCFHCQAIFANAFDRNEHYRNAHFVVPNNLSFPSSYSYTDPRSTMGFGYGCDFCPQVLSSVQEKHAHESNVHRCAFCPELFADTVGKSNHVNAAHSIAGQSPNMHILRQSNFVGSLPEMIDLTDI